MFWSKKPPVEAPKSEYDYIKEIAKIISLIQIRLNTLENDIMAINQRFKRKLISKDKDEEEKGFYSGVCLPE
jgi:hypothetical protein